MTTPTLGLKIKADRRTRLAHLFEFEHGNKRIRVLFDPAAEEFVFRALHARQALCIPARRPYFERLQQPELPL
ncbi:MAG: hypothetical protein HYR88_17945 [Verrucomicrobia bacterium]|nr:hypothetical protein [Verrucomicrobiota bacterium]MBI3868812.1 hypothetical protein [Verrucomicrobiota bacterium]